MDRIGFPLVLTVSFLTAACWSSARPESAEARALYLTEFAKTYPQVRARHRMQCSVCHIGKPMEADWNEYGVALGESLAPATNVKDREQIVRALRETETKRRSDGRTFGELLDDGELPGQ